MCRMSKKMSPAGAFISRIRCRSTAATSKPDEALGIGEELAEIQKGKDAKKIVTKLRSNDPDIDLKLRDFMCSEFFDIRTFGAVMTTFVKGALNCGQVRGPVQLGFARSIDPIVPQEVTITRTAITTESDAQNKTTEMGRKYVVPYGLYRAEGFVPPTSPAA